MDPADEKELRRLNSNIYALLMSLTTKLGKAERKVLDIQLLDMWSQVVFVNKAVVAMLEATNRLVSNYEKPKVEGD